MEEIYAIYYNGVRGQGTVVCYRIVGKTGGVGREDKGVKSTVKLHAFLSRVACKFPGTACWNWGLG